VAGRSPTLRRRELASQLRELRKQSGLSVEDVAGELLCSSAKISRIETGSRPASLRDVRDLCVLYRVGDAERTRLMTIAREAKQQGWWNKFDDLGIESLIGLEVEAIRISSYESCVIPWAFQTEQYARAVIKGFLPRIEDRILDERITARMTRQELLRSAAPPHLWSLIDESALRRAVGGSSVMREQLSRILEVAAAPNVTMQVVPFEAGAHTALDNTFALLEFDSSVQTPVVFVENIAGTFYLEREVEINRYREVLEHLRACALSPDRSSRYVEEVSRSFEALPLVSSGHQRKSIRKEVRHVHRVFYAGYSMANGRQERRRQLCPGGAAQRNNHGRRLQAPWRTYPVLHPTRMGRIPRRCQERGVRRFPDSLRSFQSGNGQARVSVDCEPHHESPAYTCRAEPTLNLFHPAFSRGSGIHGWPWRVARRSRGCSGARREYASS
jgi:transcriptional regulator with XRE-family HTH domain